MYLNQLTNLAVYNQKSADSFWNGSGISMAPVKKLIAGLPVLITL